MTAPVDVLAWLDSLQATTADGAITNRKWPEAQEVRHAVAELIEAATVANQGLEIAAATESDAFIGFALTHDRLTVALARVGAK